MWKEDLKYEVVLPPQAFLWLIGKQEKQYTCLIRNAIIAIIAFLIKGGVSIKEVSPNKDATYKLV